MEAIFGHVKRHGLLNDSAYLTLIEVRGDSL